MKCIRLFTALAVAALAVFTSSVAWAQLNPQTLREFKDANPRAQYYSTNGQTTAIFGTVLSNGDTPLDSAWNHLEQWGGMLGESIGELVPHANANGEVLQGVMFDGGNHRFYTFRFDQYFQQIPVFRSGVGFLVRNEAGNPLVMAGYDVKDLEGFDAGGVNEAEVTDAMLDNVRAYMDGVHPANRQTLLDVAIQQEIEVSDQQLVIWAGVNQVPAAPELAVVFIATRGSVQTYPNYQRELVVAAVDNGAILHTETQIHSTDITGTVNGRATNGLGAAACHPESSVPLKYAETLVVGGNTTFTNSAGQFTIPHPGTTQVTVRSRLRGQYFEVRDQSAGAAIPQIDMLVTPPGPANFLHNPNDTNEFANGNVNAYYESNRCRDYVLSYEPTFPVINTQTFFDVNTNINSTCNAFYDGVSINFYRAGGGCNNTAFSDVVYHEYGHHLISVTGNGQGQMGEGTGDVIGVLMQDDPITGLGFQNCSTGIRTAANTLQYPCNGEIHFCGQIISGAVWDTRNALVSTEPSDYRDIGASLFLGMLIVRGQMQPGNSTISPFITVLYLELDDNDGDIGNGTPHYQEIATGFGLHNLDAPPLDLLDFTYPNGRPELISAGGGVAFTVQISAGAATPQPGSGVLRLDRGNGFETFPLNQTSPNNYQAVFPAMGCATEVRYYISASTTGGSTDNDPSQAPIETYTAFVGDAQSIVFEDNFQTNKGWTVNTTAATGQWQRGVPVGGGDRGDPPVDADGSGQCYVTHNVDGDFDVDNGSTTLTSPTLNASATADQEPVLSYYRWYSNVVGNAPEQDIFVVQISNNNGSTWTNLEVVGPGGPQVQGGWIHKSLRIRDFIAPTNQMRIRFTASDTDPQSVVEAGVDGVRLTLVTCDVATDVTADQINLIAGVQTQGTLADTEVSDNQYLCIRRAAQATVGNQPTVEYEFEGTLPTDNPSELTVTLESKSDTAQVTQQIEMFNYDTAAYELVDSRLASVNSDSVAQIVLTGDVTRFVQAGTGAVTTRVIYSGGGRTRWTICTDQFFWTVE